MKFQKPPIFNLVVYTLLILGIQKMDDYKDILNILDECYILFGYDGKLSSAYSPNIEYYFPDFETFKNFGELLAKYGSISTQDAFTEFYSLIWPKNRNEDLYIDLENTLALLPKSLTISQNINLSLSYFPIQKDQSIEKIIVKIFNKEISDKKKSVEDKHREKLSVITKAANNTQSFIDFLDESEKIIDYLNSKVYENSINNEVLRKLHTLKGMFAIFDFISEVEAIHHLEDIIKDNSPQEIEHAWHNFIKLWQLDKNDLQNLLGINKIRNSEVFSKENFQRHVDLVKSYNDPKLLESLANLKRFKFKEVMDKYARSVLEMSDKHPDKLAIISVSDDSDDITHEEMQKVDFAFIHILNNCFDHGIEPIEERQKSGKPISGKIYVSFYRRDRMHFILCDDGGGIDGDKLALKAVKQGIWQESDLKNKSNAEKIELIFASGLSSKDNTSLSSGRGIGMDAVKEELEKIGGEITVESEIGVGSKFYIKI